MKTYALKNIVVPFDFSDSSIEALQAAMEIAENTEKIKVIHIIPNLTSTESMIVLGEMSEEMIAENIKKRFVQTCEENDLPELEFKAQFGDAGSSIAEFAKEKRCWAGRDFIAWSYWSGPNSAGICGRTSGAAGTLSSPRSTSRQRLVTEKTGRTVSRLATKFCSQPHWIVYYYGAIMSIDLTTQLGSLKLQSPIIVGSCPMTADEMQRIAMISNGAGALVLPSIGMWEPNGNMEKYVSQLHQVCENTSIPVFASMRVSVSSFNWFDLPEKFETAGAAAIEISLQHCPSTETNPRAIEDSLVDLIQKANRATSLPLFVKLTPNFTSISHLACRLKDNVQGLVMFGAFTRGRY